MLKKDEAEFDRVQKIYLEHKDAQNPVQIQEPQEMMQPQDMEYGSDSENESQNQSVVNASFAKKGKREQQVQVVQSNINLRKTEVLIGGKV